LALLQKERLSPLRQADIARIWSFRNADTVHEVQGKKAPVPYRSMKAFDRTKGTLSAPAVYALCYAEE
jgi:hypothetical protein